MTILLAVFLVLLSGTGSHADVQFCGIAGGGSGCSNRVGVDTNGNMQVTAPSAVAQAGFMTPAGVSGNPSTASNKRFVPLYGSENGGLRQAVPNILFDYTFNATSQNTGVWNFGATTMAGAQSGGFLTLNSGSATTVNTNAAVKTQRYFPLFGKDEIRVTITAQHTTAPQANAVTEWGFMNATIPGAAAPTDGCFFRFNASAEFRGVCSFNATEVQTAALTATSANVTHDYTIVVSSDAVVFYVDGAVVGTLTMLTDAPSQGQPFLTSSNPVTIRHINTASSPASAMQFKVMDVFVVSLGHDLHRSWESQKAGFGHAAYQGQDGGTLGTTAQYANNTNPATAVPTNTTAALGTGFGGKFQETLTLAAGTDGIISSYQNPAGGVNQTPRNLVIKGVCIGGVVTVALTTNPLAGVLALNYGHTNVSLATTESTSFTSGTTKAPRRIALYTTSVANATAAAGTPVVTGPSSCVQFTAPIVVYPGEFVAVSHNKIATAPATGSIMWTITFDAYNE